MSGVLGLVPPPECAHSLSGRVKEIPEISSLAAESAAKNGLA
jgi:hypothetical protein